MLSNRGIVTYLCSESNNKYWALPQLHYLVCDLLCLPHNVLIPLTFIFLRQSAFKSRLCWEWGVTVACRTSQHVCVTAEGTEYEVDRGGEKGGGVDRQFDYTPKWYEMKWEMEIVMSVARDEGGNDALSREVVLKRASFIPQISKR